MRSLLTLTGLVLVSVILASGAQAAPPRSQASLSLTASSYRVLYGHGTTLAGRLAGTHAAGKAVAIDAWPYGRSAPIRIAVVRTGANGGFAFDAMPGIRTTYWAHSGSATSRQLSSASRPRCR